MKYPAHTGHWPLPTMQGMPKEHHVRCDGCGVVASEKAHRIGTKHVGCAEHGAWRAVRGPALPATPEAKEPEP